MKALYNNRVIDDEITLKINDRALQFGDGLFETIRVSKTQPQHLDYHLQRLKHGADILDLTIPGPILQDLNDCIAAALQANSMDDASIKVMIWRRPSEAKGYNSTTTLSDFLILCRPSQAGVSIIEKVGFADDISFHYSQLSAIKTLNALPYILAANEKRKRKLDEIIVLNDKGFVCECSSSNIFWVNDDEYFTPPLASGCLDGVTRRVIIERLKISGTKVREQLIKPKELLKAKAIFTCNSSGIKVIAKIGEHTFDTSLAKNELLNELFN